MSLFSDNVLKNKAILVTGGGGGLGKEIARALSGHGARLHICGRRGQALESTAQEISDESSNPVYTHICNVRDYDIVDGMMDEIWEIGPLTGLVNNAAANFISPSKDLSANALRSITSTVMDGSFNATLSLGKRWIDQGIKGAVVSNLVSWVWTGSAFVLPSAMAKTAIHAMTMSLAVEWGKYGIRLNATAPGPFPTPEAWQKLSPIPGMESSATGCDTIPMGRHGQIRELQNLITFLLADGCDFLTGQTIAIDGAQHLAGPGTFADLSRVSDEKWAEARAAIKVSSAKLKAEQGK